MLGMEKDVSAAVGVIQGGTTRAIDIGCVNGRFFDNNSAVGLEPMVTITQAGMKHVKGTLRYVLAAVLTVLRHRPWQMRLAWDGGDYVGPVALVSVGNTRRTGGAFFMTPRASPDDGWLDFIYGGEIGRPRLLRLLPTTFDGSHIEEPEISYERTAHLTIDCEPGTPIQADGELFEESATHIEYSILPGVLRVLVAATKAAPGSALVER
jgi:diacylglycerol kinase (ATP)